MPGIRSLTATECVGDAVGMRDAFVHPNTMKDPSLSRRKNHRLKKSDASGTLPMTSRNHFSNTFSKHANTETATKTTAKKFVKKAPATGAHFFTSSSHRDPLQPPTMSLEEVMKCNEDAMEALRQNELEKSNELIGKALQASEGAARWYQKDTSRPNAHWRSKRVQSDSGNSQGQWIHCEGWLLLYAVSLNNMGCQLRREGKIDEALTCLEKARDVETHVCGRPSCSTMMNLSTLLLSMGKVEEAFPIAQQCVVTAQDGDRVLFITALHNLAITLGRHAAAKPRSAALPTMLRALREAQNHFGADHATTGLLKSLCDGSHGWILGDCPSSIALPEVAPAKPAGGARPGSSTTARTATSPAARLGSSAAGRAGRIGGGGGGGGGGRGKGRGSASPARPTASARRRAPAHLAPLRQTTTATQPSPAELQARAQQALATLHFGTPLASPMHTAEEEKETETEEEEGREEIDLHIDTQLDAGEPSAGSASGPSAVVFGASPSLDAASGNNLDPFSEPLDGVVVPKEGPQGRLLDTADDTAKRVGDSLLPRSVHDEVPLSDTGPGHAFLSNLDASTGDDASSPSTSDNQNGDKNENETLVKVSTPEDGTLSEEKVGNALASTLACKGRVPGYYISLSETAQPKYLRFVAGNPVSSIGTALTQHSPRRVSHDSRRDPSDGVTFVEGVPLAKTRGESRGDSKSRELQRKSISLLLPGCGVSRDGSKARSSCAQETFDTGITSNDNLSNFTHVLGKDIDTATQIQRNSHLQAEKSGKMYPLKVFSHDGKATLNKTWESAIVEELKEEELFRQKRAREQMEAAKKAERKAIMQRIQARVHDRAARRIQQQWRRWWEEVGWARREARRVRAEERSRYLVNKNLAEMLATGDKRLSAKPSSCQYYGIMSVAVSCGIKWFRKTTCIRYLARNGLPHKGLKESDIYRSVAKIQATWRGFSTRLCARQSNETRIAALNNFYVQQCYKERREYAAIVLQKFARTILAKKKLAEYHFARYDPPARRIQLWFRNIMSSLHSRGLDRLTMWTCKIAAVRIQRAWRRHQLRIQYYMYRLRLRINALRDNENMAALQSATDPSAKSESRIDSPMLMHEGLSHANHGVDFHSSEEAANVEANKSDVKEFKIVVPRTSYELECLERAPYITRLLEEEHENFHVPMFSEPVASAQRQEWMDAINDNTLEINQQRAAVAYLQQEHEEDAINWHARKYAAVRIQRAFRSWLRMRDDPHRDRVLLLHSRQIYQKRESIRRQEHEEAAAARQRAIKRYGDVARPMRECHRTVREELTLTLQSESLQIIGHSSNTGER